MKLTADYLQKEEELIHEEIYMLCEKLVSDDVSPVYDGIVNVEKYISGEKYRICWVLKELYDGEGGDWYLSDFIGDGKKWKEIIKHPAWKRAIYATYGITNDFHEYSDMDYINDDPSMVQCLHHIAVINVNKMPAGHSSNDADVAKKYEHFKPLLLRQLEKYDPQIIIFGNTFQHFKGDLGIKDEELTNYYKDKIKPRFIVKDGKLYLDAYHPAVRTTTMTEGDYVQSIIDVVKMNKDNIK